MIILKGEFYISTNYEKTKRISRGLYLEWKISFSLTRQAAKTEENICANSLFAWTNIATVTSRANYPFLLSVSLFAVDTFEETQISPFNQKLLSPRGQMKGCRGYAHPWGDLRLILLIFSGWKKAKQSKNKTKQKKKTNKNKRRWGHFLVVCPSWEKSWIRPWPIPTDKSIYHGFSQTMGHTFPAVSNMWKITSSPSMSTRCWYQLSIDKISNFWYFCWRLTKCQQLLYLRL